MSYIRSAWGNYAAIVTEDQVAAASAPSGLTDAQDLRGEWNGQVTAADIAAVLTYVRSSWGNDAVPVSEQQVAAIK